jgi:hypothetical protein
VAGYGNYVCLNLNPDLGGLLVGEMTVEHLREMFAAVVYLNQQDGLPPHAGGAGPNPGLSACSGR